MKFSRLLLSCLLLGVIVCEALPAVAQDTRGPTWDARGLGPIAVQWITSLDVAADGSRITVGTIAPTGTPSVHVLDRDGKLVKSHVVNQRWIAQVASASGDRAFALCTMPSGTAFDEPLAFACGESTVPIAGGTGGGFFFHYGDGIHDLCFGMSQRNEVVVLLGSPEGLSLDHMETIKLDVQLHFEHSVRVVDFNHDGRPDLGVFALVSGGPFTPYVWLQPERAK